MSEPERRMTVGKWLVFDIGCIECGEPSQPVGVYGAKEEAERVAEEYVDDDKTRWGRPEWHGQHCVGVYEIKETE